MSGASVESIDALRQFRARLCKLAEQVKAALNEADGELSRTSDWLTHAQTLYWSNQLRTRAEDLTRARSALTRKKTERSPSGARQSCIEEEKAFKKAQRLLEEAQQKAAAVKRWIRKLDETAFTYRPVAQGLMSTVEVDVPRGLARVDGMVTALEAYLVGGPPPEWVKSEAPIGEMVRAEQPQDETTEPDLPAVPSGQPAFGGTPTGPM